MHWMEGDNEIWIPGARSPHLRDSCSRLDGALLISRTAWKRRFHAIARSALSSEPQKIFWQAAVWHPELSEVHLAKRLIPCAGSIRPCRNQLVWLQNSDEQ